MATPGQVTELLHRFSDGDRAAMAELLPLIYDELRGPAEQLMRHERPDHTLQATALVHEAYLRLVDQARVRWHDRTHFLAVASTVMRRILVDHARTRGRLKRGGERKAQALDDVRTALAEGTREDLIALDDALRALEAADPLRARIVELRYFGGMTMEQIATFTGVPLRSVERSWRAARTWLYQAMTSEAANEAGPS